MEQTAEDTPSGYHFLSTLHADCRFLCFFLLPSCVATTAACVLPSTGALASQCLHPDQPCCCFCLPACLPQGPARNSLRPWFWRGAGGGQYVCAPQLWQRGALTVLCSQVMQRCLQVLTVVSHCRPAYTWLAVQQCCPHCPAHTRAEQCSYPRALTPRACPQFPELASSGSSGGEGRSGGGRGRGGRADHAPASSPRSNGSGMGMGQPGASQMPSSPAAAAMYAAGYGGQVRGGVSNEVLPACGISSNAAYDGHAGGICAHLACR